MAEYLVTWEIDISADNPTEAALIAENIQYQQTIMCTQSGVFKVLDKSTNKETTIDLDEYYKS